MVVAQVKHVMSLFNRRSIECGEERYRVTPGSSHNTASSNNVPTVPRGRLSVHSGGTPNVLAVHTIMKL